MSAASTRAGLDEPSISAVVINFNGAERTLNCLAALLRQTRLPAPIVVVDNGSTDDSLRKIEERFPAVERLALGANRGLPAARNAGLAHVASDLVLLVDNDVYPEPDCVEKLAAAWLETGASVVCPRVRLLPETGIVQADGAAAHFVGTLALRHGYRPADELPVARAEVGGCIGACYLLERRAALEAGGFDELYFFYFEDLEFALRMRARGHRFLAEPAAVVFHDRGRGTPGLSYRGTGEYPVRRGYLSMRHRLLTLAIHYRARTLLLLAPALAVYELASLALALQRGWGGAWLRAWGWMLRNAGRVRQRRRSAQRARVCADRELLAGGPLPLAPGLTQSRLAGGAIALLSRVLDAYWRAARHWIG